MDNCQAWKFAVLVLTVLLECARSEHSEEQLRTGYACEGSTLTIDCGDLENKKIWIVRANYGRQNIGICNEGGDTSGWNLQCISTRAASRVSQICNGTGKCSVTASNVHFDADPCPDTVKYLEIQYRCVQELPITSGEPPMQPTTTTMPPPTTTTTEAPTTTATPPPTTEAPPKIPTTKQPEAPTKKPEVPSPPPMKYTTTTERMQGDQGRIRTHCEQTETRDVTWPRTKRGAWAIQPCPNNPSVNRAMWRCSPNKNSVEWLGKPDLSGCESQQLHDLGSKLAMLQEEFSADVVTEVASELQQTSTKSNLYGGDIKTMAVIMDDMVKEVNKQSVNTTRPISKRFIQNVTESVLTTSSNMLGEDKDDSWTDLPQSTQAETATRVISSVEDSAQQLANTYQEPTVVVNITLNIILEVNVVDTRAANVPDLYFPTATTAEKPSRSDLFSNGNSIRLSGNSLKELGPNGLARAIFLTYNNLEKWLRPPAPEPPIQTRGPGQPRPDLYQEFEGREAEVFIPEEFDFQPAVRDYPVDPVADQGGAPENELERGRDWGYGDESEVVVEESTTTTTTTTTTTVPTTEATTSASEVDTAEKVVNSKIISASIVQPAATSGERKSGHIPLSEPVFYTLEHKTTNNVYNPTCSFWEYSEKTMSGRWSTFGCRVKETNTSHTTCACNHITNFAVLMDVQAQELSDENEFALAFITYLGCIISVVCLFLAFLTFAVFKNLQSDRNTIHKNLVLSLLIAEVLFLAGIMQHKLPVLCSVIAAFLHYWFLAAFMWMLMEGIQLYVMLVQVFESEKSRVKYYYLLAYGTPAIIVAISAAVDHTGYGTPAHCWLSAEGGFIWAFVGPVVAITTVNIVMLSIAIYQMCKHADAAAGWKMKQKSKMENVRSWVKGASVLVVLLGLTWTFGLLYINRHTLFMAYIFTILNSLQGLFIFIFHCVMNEKVQKEYKRCVRRASWLPETLRVKYGDAPSTSPNQSSASGNYLTRLLSSKRRKRSSTTTVRSSLSNPSRSTGHYQNMKNDPVSPRESAHMTDSGIGRHPESVHDTTTEDNGGYLEPVSLRVNDQLLDDLERGADYSIMEGSCVDTDYYGIDGTYRPTPTSLDVDKYKIRAANEGTSSDSQGLSDKELLRLEEKERMGHDYEELLPVKSRSDGDEESETSDLDGGETTDDCDTLVREKLRKLEGSTEDLPKRNLNNLNKGDNEAFRDSVHIARPNIMGREDTLKHSVPLTKQNDCKTVPDSAQKPAIGVKLSTDTSSSHC